MARRASRRAGRVHGVALLEEPLHGSDLAGTGARDGATRLDALLNMVRAGQSPRQAAIAAGVSSETWRRWMVEAGVTAASGWEATNDRAPEFLRVFWGQVQRARAQWLARLSASVTSGIPRNPAVGVKILRQVDPDGQWGIDDDPPAPPEPRGVPSIGNVERAVIVLDMEKVKGLLRDGLAAEAADGGDSEDDDADHGLEGLAEVVVPDGARRK